MRIYVPDAKDGYETFPVIVVIHGMFFHDVPSSSFISAFCLFSGGGFILGSLEYDDENCRRLCITHGAVIFNVDYRLAPEYPYPTPPDDCSAALKWVSAPDDSLPYESILTRLLSR